MCVERMTPVCNLKTLSKSAPIAGARVGRAERQARRRLRRRGVKAERGPEAAGGLSAHKAAARLQLGASRPRRRLRPRAQRPEWSPGPTPPRPSAHPSLCGEARADPRVLATRATKAQGRAQIQGPNPSRNRVEKKTSFWRGTARLAKGLLWRSPQPCSQARPRVLRTLVSLSHCKLSPPQ